MRGLWTPKWVLVHLAVLVLVVVFLRLGWWQLTRAASGNLLSYGYALQWPAFAVFVVFVWLKEVRGARRRPDASNAETAEADRAGPEQTGADQGRPSAGPRPPRRPVRTGPAYEDEDDAELAAYNRYLAWLNAHPGASPRDYPG